MVVKKANKDPRVSRHGLLVLRAFMDDPTAPMSGADFSKRFNIASGTVYPILLRFEQAEWLESKWEAIDPSVEKRPKRRLYFITGVGQKRAIELLSDFTGWMSA